MTYEYTYTREDGTVVEIERSGIPMSKASDPIEVVDPEDGNTYIATRIISLTANMGYTWEYDTNTADLPPVNATPKSIEKQFKEQGR